MKGIVKVEKSASFGVTTADDQDIVKQLEELARQSDAFSPNTINQLKYVFNVWCTWCRENERPQLPAQPEDVKAFIQHLRAGGLAASTISTYKTYLNIMHRHLGLEPITADLSVNREIRATSRRAAMDGEKTGQAIPLRKSDLRELEAYWKDSDRLVDLRNLAAIYMSYSTMLRVSELARIKVGHLRYQTNGTILIDVSYTKTITGGYGLIKILGKRATSIVNRWIEAAGIADNPEAFVIAPITRFNTLRKMEKPLTRPNLNAILAAAWHRLDKPLARTNKGRYATWTGHSCRVGAAQDLLLSGASLAAIMHEGTWRDPKQAMSYLREIEAQNSKIVALLDEDE